MSTDTIPNLAVIDADDAAYCCPGESQPISRSVHLGRLARFYAGCLDCPRRHETGPLTKRQDKQLTQWSNRRRDQLAFENESIRGGYPDQLGPRPARELAAAFAAHLRESLDTHAAPPVSPQKCLTIMIASDGAAMTADVQAAMIEGLRFAGCDVVDIGFATAPVLATAIANQKIAGGVLIGSRNDPTPQIVLRMFGQRGRPLTAGGDLDDVMRRHEAGVPRASRSSGTLRRAQVAAPYLANFLQYFHALRPLRFVMLTPSRTLRKYVDELTADVACQNVASQSDQNGQQLHQRDTAPTTAGRLSERVLNERADFGISIDVFGELSQVVDERGAEVDSSALAACLEEDRPPIGEDGLQVLARLLTRLSQSDRVFSATLAAAALADDDARR